MEKKKLGFIIRTKSGKNEVVGILTRKVTISQDEGTLCYFALIYNPSKRFYTTKQTPGFPLFELSMNG